MTGLPVSASHTSFATKSQKYKLLLHIGMKGWPTMLFFPPSFAAVLWVEALLVQ